MVCKEDFFKHPHNPPDIKSGQALYKGNGVSWMWNRNKETKFLVLRGD